MLHDISACLFHKTFDTIELLTGTCLKIKLSCYPVFCCHSRVSGVLLPEGSFKTREMTRGLRATLIVFVLPRGQKILLQILARRRHSEFSMLHPLCPDQLVGDIFYVLRPSFYHDDLEAVVFIKVYMHGRKDRLVVMMLQGGKGVSKFPGIMGVDKGNRPDGLGGIGLPFLGNEAVPYQIPDGLASARVPLFLYETVEFFTQRAFERYAEPYDGHGVTISQIVAPCQGRIFPDHRTESARVR